MTPWSTAVGASVLAHGLHYAMVLAGLWGLAALLVPHALTRLSRTHPPPPDDHDRRVTALRAAVASGTVRTVVPTDPLAVGTPSPALSLPVLSVPLAIVASAAAAGTHAAVAPPHLREQAATGLFLLLAAVAQLAWAAAMQRPTAALMRAGIVLQLGLVALWLLTRTAGLPFGLLPEPHPVGAWDLTCVAWQVLAAASCARVLRDGDADHDRPSRCPSWFDWHPSTRAAVGAAAVSMTLLTLIGTPS